MDKKAAETSLRVAEKMALQCSETLSFNSRIIRAFERDLVLERMNETRMGALILYPTPVQLTERSASHELRIEAFPVAELSANGILSFPIYPHITDCQQQIVVDAPRAAGRGAR